MLCQGVILAIMIAVVIVRDGVLPAGFDEAICEAGRRTLLVGSGIDAVLESISTVSSSTWTLRVDPLRTTFSHLASAIVDCLGNIGGLEPGRTAAEESIVVPASPDGRDVAPHLAFALDVALHAGATSVTATSVTVSRGGGLHLLDIRCSSPFVATLQIGIRGAEMLHDRSAHDHAVVDVTASSKNTATAPLRSVQSIEVQPPDASTMDLSEARRIVGGGAGLEDAGAFAQLQNVATALGASMGVTRVVTDRGWVGHERQIGTTGVVVDPDLYISFGVSGAVQHTSGLGQPDHIISINTDAHCPMMQISDLAIVADANEVLDHLERLLLESPRSVAT